MCSTKKPRWNSFPGFSLLPESPRWLIAKGRNEAAVKFVRKAAKINKKVVPEKLLEDTETHAEAEEAQKGSFIEVFKNASLLRRTGIVFFNWYVFGRRGTNNREVLHGYDGMISIVINFKCGKLTPSLM
jgi:hypothetical protein